MTNSRDKGARGERLWRDILREHGFNSARRGQQFSGSKDSPDVICPELPTVHFEVKFVEKLSIEDAMNQAIKDAQDKLPIVAHKKKNRDWLITLKANDFLNLIKKTDMITSIPGNCLDE